MSNNQLHGKKFEDIIKSAFPGASDFKRTNTSKFDIESRFDRVEFLATSIKSSKSLIVGMADARRFMKQEEPFRLLVGLYEQKEDIKEFTEIREYFFTKEILDTIKGDLQLAEVEEFHLAINVRSGLEGQKEGRMKAEEFHEKLKNKNTFLILNPKIDSKNQRRLQCSLNLTKIESIKTLKYEIYTKRYKDLVLPLRIVSSSRVF